MTIIGTQRPEGLELIPVGCPQAESLATGWDILREEFWAGSINAIQRGQTRTFEDGTYIVQDIRVGEYRAGKPMLEVTSLGIAGGYKDYKIFASGMVAEDTSLAYATSDIWRNTNPRVTKLWLSTTVPSIVAHVGIPSVPPILFGYPGDAWSFLPIITDSVVVGWDADGWVGESRTPDLLPGSTYCMVTDVWIYDMGYTDRD